MAAVGEYVGEAVGGSVAEFGFGDGSHVGATDGIPVGNNDGVSVGSAVELLGARVGIAVNVGFAVNVSEPFRTVAPVSLGMKRMPKKERRRLILSRLMRAIRMHRRRSSLATRY
jgi:hypothetical protein